MKKILIIIPAYNEEANILKTCEKIINYNMKNKTNYDMIVINDGSIDNTQKILEDNNISHINLIHNLGIGGAVQTGYKYAYDNNYDIAIQFDGDGQHQAKYLKDLITQIEEGNCDIAIGSRFVIQKKPVSLRMFGSMIIEKCIKLTTGQKIKDVSSGMRAYNKKAIEELAKNPSLTPEPDTLVYMIKKGMKVKEVQVEMKDREFGESYLNTFKSIKYMIDMMKWQ